MNTPIARTAAAAIMAFFLLLPLMADPASLVAQGRSLQARDDWYGAIESYQEAVRGNPGYADAFRGLAECFYALGEYEKAMTEAEKAISLRKNDTALTDLRGFILIGLGRLDEARQTFQGVLAKAPNDIQARFGLGEIEIASGRISAAGAEYSEALRRNPSNRQALLSLALVSYGTGNGALARDYAEEALRYYSDDKVAYYVYAWLASAQGDLGEAERYVRKALALDPAYDDANALFASVLYRDGRLAEVIEACNSRISRNRSAPGAWYLRALCLMESGKPSEALASAVTGLEITPEDEVLRSLYEGILLDFYAIESSERNPASKWHAARATDYERKNLSDQAVFEYRRALTLNPYDIDSRVGYAKQLLTRGYPARYLGQLEFIQSLGKATTAVNDAVEAYKKALSSSVAEKWSIDPLYLDKSSVDIGLYWLSSHSASAHPDAVRITASVLADAFVQENRFTVRSASRASSSYSEAFRLSRTAGEDYFGLLSFEEGDRNIKLSLDLYLSSSGALAQKFEVFRTGNDRYVNGIRRLMQTVSASMPLQGRLLKRYQGQGVINLGKADGISEGDKFDILRKDALSWANEGIAVNYDPENVLGSFTVTSVEGDISLGTLARTGFYDRINPGDSVVLQRKDAEGAAGIAVNGAPRTSSPALLELIRKIR